MAAPLIRIARPADRAQVLALVPRLRAFGGAILRTADDLDTGETRCLNAYFDSSPEDQRLWVAEDHDGTVIGAALAETEQDYFTEEDHVHLGILMVAEQAIGRGVGAALMQMVELWARERGSRFLTLNVFAANERAQTFYRKGGFEPDYIRYIKPLGD